MKLNDNENRKEQPKSGYGVQILTIRNFTSIFARAIVIYYSSDLTAKWSLPLSLYWRNGTCYILLCNLCYSPIIGHIYKHR